MQELQVCTTYQRYRDKISTKNDRVIVTSPICKYNERLTIARRCIAKRRILTKMDNKRINWRFAGTVNKGYPFDSLLRQIAETADF